MPPPTTTNDIIANSIQTLRDAITKTKANYGPNIPNTSYATRRLLSEMKTELQRIDEELQRGDHEYIPSIIPLENNLQELVAAIPGPPATPYEGGIFYMRLSVPGEYPLKPPRVWFLTKVYHPNIGSEGKICNDVLENEWGSVWTIHKVVIALASLLASPSLDNSVVPEIAAQCMGENDRFERTAREWTQRYATKEINPFNQKHDFDATSLLH
ncbi:hypothetical protein B7463_g146, partial [Scytalidium lignicola]